VLPVHKASPSKLIKAPLLGFVASSKGSFQEERDLPKVRTSDGFDPNAYKLMKKSGYDFSQPTPLGHVIEVKPHKLNSTQRASQSQGSSVTMPKVDLGYIQPQPVRISERHKDKQGLGQYIIAEEVDNDSGGNADTNPKTSVFDWLQSSTSR